MHMNRFYQFIVSFILLFSLSAVSIAAPENPTQPIYVKSPRHLPHFSNIDVSDHLEVIVTGGHARQSVVLMGDSRAVAEISTEVRGKTLFIERTNPPSTSEPYNHHIVVRINLNTPISGISASEAARVRVKNIKSHGLTLVARDHAFIKLDGRGVVLRRVDNYSTQNMVIFGINTKYLHIKGVGKGEIILGGTVGTLTAYLYDQACLRAERLVAQHAYIHTEGQAIAQVLAIQDLYAFAKGYSNIYYYKTPDKQLVRHTQDWANVLKIP